MTVIAGVSLESYAFVHAALGEGHLLDAILEHEGIDPRAWPTIDEGWADALSDSIDGDLVLSDMYDAELMNVQDRFVRSVEPLGAHYAAYMRFVRHWSNHEDPSWFLADNGLRTSDMMRLQRYWSERIHTDADMRREAAEAAAEPDTIPAPSVVVGQARTLSEVRPPTARPATRTESEASPKTSELPPLIAPLPAAPTDHAEALAQAISLTRQPPPELAAPTAIDMTVERYGELHAHLATFGNEASVFEKFGIEPSQLAAIDQLFTERFASDPTLSPRFHRAYTDTYDGLQRKR